MVDYDGVDGMEIKKRNAKLLLLAKETAEEALVLLTRERILHLRRRRLGLRESAGTTDSLVQRRSLLGHFTALGFSSLGHFSLLRRSRLGRFRVLLLERVRLGLGRGSLRLVGFLLLLHRITAVARVDSLTRLFIIIVVVAYIAHSVSPRTHSGLFIHIQKYPTHTKKKSKKKNQ